jgi:two-component system, chemotaxis family, sensor kinase CheA
MNDDALKIRLRATFLEELDELVVALNSEVLALERAPVDPAPRRAVFRIFHTLKGASRAAGIGAVERACHVFEGLVADVPADQPVDGGRIAGLLEAADALGEAAARLRRGEELDELPIRGAAPTRGDDPAALSAELASAPPRHPPVAAPAPAPAPAARKEAAAAPASAPASSTGTLRVRADRLEELASSAFEIVALAGRAGHNGERLAALAEAMALAPSKTGLSRERGPREIERQRALGREARALARAALVDSRALAQRARELGAQVRGARLRPFADACESLPRMVRDLAAQLGKEASFRLEGGAVQADRAVIDALRDPLVQLVRNAVDHGIEPPEARLRAGKTREGTVTVRAALVGDLLVVTVADDGQGIDEEALRRRFTQREGSAPADKSALARRLLTAGISSRDSAGPVSGRGVGTELAGRAVEGLGGRIDVTWTRGLGTVFTLECPSSMTSTRVVLASVGDRTVALPTAAVERLLRVRPEDVRKAAGQPSLPTAAGMAPVASLALLLGPPLVERVVPGVRPAILLRDGTERLIVTVDALLAEAEVVVTPLEGGERVPALNGVALLASGELALVVNVAAVLRRATPASAPTAAPRRAAATRVLVVDDSITTRTLEKTLLEDAGFEVALSVDGEQAWTRLLEERFDVVVADVEMPVLDGLALARRIRGDPRTRSMPLVLVTSLATPEDKQRGVEAGADAYLVKSEFDREALLETIRHLIDETPS